METHKNRKLGSVSIKTLIFFSTTAVVPAGCTHHNYYFLSLLSSPRDPLPFFFFSRKIASATMASMRATTVDTNVPVVAAAGRKHDDAGESTSRTPFPSDRRVTPSRSLPPAPLRPARKAPRSRHGGQEDGEDEHEHQEGGCARDGGVAIAPALEEPVQERHMRRTVR